MGGSDSAALRPLRGVLPRLAAAGRDSRRVPMPHPTQRRSVEHLLHAVPEVQVLVDSFAQRCQCPQRRHEADGYYWGKKKMHTLKRQGGTPRAETSWTGP